MDNIEKEILKAVTRLDYQKGLNYDEDYIDHVGTSNISNQKTLQFLVESERSNKKYVVQVDSKNGRINRTFCTCPQFRETQSCKHVAACLVCYSDKLLSIQDTKVVELKTKQLFQKLKSEFENEIAKKEEVHVIPYITKDTSYYYDVVTLKVKIGVDKMYSLLGKYNAFKNAFRDEEEYNFGTNFKYDPKKHFFNETSLKVFSIINGLANKRSLSGNSIVLDDDSLKELLKLFKDGIYMEENRQKTPIRNAFPLQMNLSKENHKYKMHFESDIQYVESLTEDYEYILLSNVIYHLNKKQRVLLEECLNHNMKEFIFEESAFDDFQKSVLRVVKDSVKLDESVKDLVLVSKPEVKFYFDLNEDNITCIPKFIYNEEEVSFFDKSLNIIRDVDYESEVVNILASYEFHKMNHIFLLDDFDLMCEFMDGGLDEISKIYPVYTSENLKNTNVLKSSSITTHFSIGQGQILNYDFDLGGIDNSELDNILLSMKAKKKYFRLKNGDILSLEQDNLKQLKDLTEELEIEGDQGTIPKYRALYLDSLKEKKYGIIKTDSFFQQFIQQFKEFQHSEVSFTDNELQTLRDYQIDGVKWLYTICKCGFGGILADEMGLGKSLQTITFIKRLLEEANDAKFLIVCPTSLVYNWENEFLKFAPELKFQVFSGNRVDRRSLLDSFSGNIFITSYGLLREDIEVYQSKSFRVFVIDEAQNIKNPKTGLAKAVKSIISETKLALTGTPIENSIVELWSIFDFIMPGFLSSLVKFQQKYKIKEFDEDTNKLLATLKAQVKPFILRRKKADVVKDLPDKIENNIFIDLNEEQKKYYAAEVKYVNDEMTKLIQSGGFIRNKMLILSLLTKLRQLCIDPRICIDNYNGGSSKIEHLIDQIKEVVANGHKILLFTSFKTALNIVHEELEKENISSYIISGDVPSKKRQMLVDAFNKDETNVFLIMLKSGGTGLNLTSADVVIHLDLWWNPQAENQATDRTHRIGQTKNVEVIKLICKGTIEEKILALQEKKKILSDKMIEEDMDDNTYLKNLSEQDIRDLLAYENKD